MTPAGEAAFKQRKAYGAATGQGGRGQVVTAESNDPFITCDPLGFPRANLYQLRHTQILQSPKKVVILYQYDKRYRVIWTDGRDFPKELPDDRWYGYSVGHWEGDTFVVNSNNFDGATWLDQYGSPHSDQMTVEERYRRVDQDHLEMVLNITDPKTYIGTWKGDKKIFQLVEKPARSEYKDLPEGICAFSEVKLHGKAWQQIHP